MTIEEFVKLLWDRFCGGKSCEDVALLHYGHVAGWLEDQDEVHPTAQLDKRTAARITHQFMKIELHIPDAPDISKAEVLKDLYTCRVCANHVAQVYVKNIMECDEEIDPSIGKPVLLFNMLAPVSSEDAERILEKVQNQF